jgi:phage N-6-adenine-methyltransferase
VSGFFSGPALTSVNDEWSTPDDFFRSLDAEFGFTLDVCATPENAKCARFYTRDDDGLSQPWDGVVWMNPPYGARIGEWMERAYHASLRGVTVVCLVPARTDTAWWHNYAAIGDVRCVRGRL